MASSRRRTLRAMVVSISSLLVVSTVALSASASHGKDGDPLSEVPALFDDDASYGTITDHDDSTEPNGKTADDGCGQEGEGASVYKFDGKIGTKIDLDITDDIAGQSLDCVGLYRQHLGDETLPALYGFPELGDYEVHYDQCVDSHSVCRSNWVLPEDDTYYLAFWPEDCCEDANYATFSFSISIRKPTKTKLSLDGPTKEVGDKCYSVDKGSTATANIQVTEEATGGVKVNLERRKDGNWKLIATDQPELADSRASSQQTFKKAGQYRVWAHYLGDDSRAPSKSKKICLRAG